MTVSTNPNKFRRAWDRLSASVRALADAGRWQARRGRELLATNWKALVQRGGKAASWVRESLVAAFTTLIYEPVKALKWVGGIVGVIVFVPMIAWALDQVRNPPVVVERVVLPDALKGRGGSRRTSNEPSSRRSPASAGASRSTGIPRSMPSRNSRA